MKDEQTAARTPKALKAKLAQAAKMTPGGASALIRVSLEEFFENHKSRQQIVEAVVASLQRVNQ